MSVAARLFYDYNVDLMENSDVRQLMKSVSQNPQNETIDYVKTRKSVREIIATISKDNVQTARRALIAFLNAVWFDMGGLSDEWWFEMHTRIAKSVALSLVLEGDNLRSFGTEENPVTPESSDIPLCLIGLSVHLDTFHSFRFNNLRKEFEKKIKIMSNDVIDLYTKNE
jgi:hypothetical protein